MKREVFITKLARFLPNEPVTNEAMETRLGMIGGKPSKARRIILERNGIKVRHYAIDETGKLTHTNAELTALAIGGLLSPACGPEDVELLCCGTSVPDQILPSHASMVHGCLGWPTLEIMSAAGVCGSGMQAMKYGMMSILGGNSSNAVCAGSELVSPLLLSRNYEDEISNLGRLKENPLLAFEKDFLRWMLSDGAGAALLAARPNDGGALSLRLDWIDICSYAGKLQPCMYAGLDRIPDGRMVSWKAMAPEEWLTHSVFAIKQDVSLLNEHIVRLATETMCHSLRKHGLKATDIDCFLPHISSEFFRAPLAEEMEKKGVGIPQDKWFTNLARVGNVGSASIYLMLEELSRSGKLDRGMKVLGMVPESGRFSYAFILLTVC